MFVYAGYQGKEELNDLWEFDLATHEWKKVEGEGELPPARSVHTTNLIGTTLFPPSPARTNSLRLTSTSRR